MNEKIKLGISRCLLGNNVRYNGGHKREPSLLESLDREVEFVPVCPEVEIGLPIPREPVQLVRESENTPPRMMTVNTKIDHTERMTAWLKVRLDQLEHMGVSGFVFKSESPSCAVKDLDIFNERGKAWGKGSGIFARAFMERFVGIPVAEEQELRDAAARKEFMERVTAIHLRLAENS